MALKTGVDSSGNEFVEVWTGQPGASTLAATFTTAGVQAVVGAGTPGASTCTTGSASTSYQSPLVIAGNADAAVTARTGGTVKAPDVATGGAGNVAGTDLKVRGGVGTGTGTPGKVLLQAAPVASSGDNAQTAVTQVTIESLLVTLADGVNIGIAAGTGSKIGGASSKIGFFNATPVAQPTGVAVDAAGIHAALVTLGLIAA